MKNPYSVLGVTPNCTVKQLKAAYLKLSQKLHPDKSKAKNAKALFQELQKAYAILKDPARRRHYDNTGKDSKLTARQITDQANNMIAHSFMSLIERSQFEPKNYFFEMQDALRDELAHIKKGISVTNNNMDKAQYLFNNTKAHKVVMEGMQRKITTYEQQLTILAARIPIVERAMVLLKEFEYTGQHPASPSTNTSGFGNFGF